MKKKTEQTKPAKLPPHRPVETKNRELTDRELRLVNALYEMGKTDAEVAAVLGVARTSLFEMLKRQGLVDTIKVSKDVSNLRVEASLYNSATGYDYTEDHLLRDLGITVKVTKHQPGSDTARIFWLCNRDPEKWQSLSRVINERAPGDIEKETAAWADKILQLRQAGLLCDVSGANRSKAPGNKKAGRK